MRPRLKNSLSFQKLNSKKVTKNQSQSRPEESLHSKGSKIEWEGAALFASTWGQNFQARWELYSYTRNVWGPNHLKVPIQDCSLELEQLTDSVLDVKAHTPLSYNQMNESDHNLIDIAILKKKRK